MNASFDKNCTLNLGDAQAAHSATVFANLGCPWCRRWFVNNWSAMVKAIQENKLAVHLKFLNKPKAPLHNGNVANGFVDYQNPEAGLLFVKNVYQHQDVLDNLTNDKDVVNLLETHFNAKPVVSDQAKQQIINEAKNSGVTSVPTIFFDGVKHPDSGWNLPQM